MILPWPNHLLTLQEWEALPEDSGQRLEFHPRRREQPLVAARAG